MSLYRSRRPPSPIAGPSEFELLKASHKFLREDDEDETKDQTWEEKLASKYYSSLYREFAVCDLKHYKSGNFSLRWRTENEVLSGAGEESCGNTRCTQHDPRAVTSSLSTLELPFAYTEHDVTKSALVKTVLCPKCLNKLMWKRRREKKESGGHDRTEDDDEKQVVADEKDEKRSSYPRERQHRRDEEKPRRRRSASPRRRH